MEYTIFRLSFSNGIHIGDRSLEKPLFSFCADTLYSALYIEANAESTEKAAWLDQVIREGKLMISDAFPYIKDTEFLPKPILPIQRDASEKGDSVRKKAFKKLSFIPLDQMETFLAGNLDPVEILARLKKLGVAGTKTSAAISHQEETLPYHVGTYRFFDGNGLFFIAGVEGNDVYEPFSELMTALSFSGIGGKRSSGFGRFEIVGKKKLDSYILEQTGGYYMTLSISLPKEEEMEDVLINGCYQVLKRGGFVQSATYAEQPMKKQELFMLSAGSCFKKRYEGDIYDVSLGGSHPVYKYGKPIFWPLS